MEITLELELYIENLRDNGWQYNKQFHVLISPLGYFEIVLTDPLDCKSRFIVNADNIVEHARDAYFAANTIQHIQTLTTKN